MSDRDRVMKAADVFAKSTPMFGTKAQFTDAFPEISNIHVEVDFGSDPYLGRIVHSYDAKSLPGEFINCRKQRCYNGGFSIGSILREMVRQRQTEKSETIYCQGYEGSPKGRKNYGRCHESFKVDIRVEYRDANPNNPR